MKSVRQLRLFLVSPSDVQEERLIAEAVISSLNKHTLSRSNIRVELLGWETDTYPAFGSDPQDIINRQVGDDVDVLAAIFWTRVGTPTPRYQSGSVEEITRFANLRRTAGSPEIMVFFKRAAVDYDQIDPEQIAALKAFRREIEPQCLLREFVSADEFREVFRACVEKTVFEIEKRSPVLGTSSAGDPESAFDEPLNATDEDDGLGPGFLDLQIELFKNVEEVVSQQRRFSPAIAKLNGMLGEKTRELEALGKVDNPLKLIRAQQVVSEVASGLSIASKELDLLTYKFRAHMGPIIDSASQILGHERLLTDPLESGELLEAISSVRESFGAFGSVVARTADTVEKGPNVSKQLRLAQKTYVKKARSFHSELDRAALLMQDLIDNFEGKIGRAQ